MREKFVIVSFLIYIISIFGFSTLAMAEDSAPMASNSEGEMRTTTQKEPQWQTTATITEPSKYGAHFVHYDFVNPNAPKGGTLNLIAVGTFDSLNPYIVAGTPPQGLVPLFGGLLYDTLLNQSVDQGGLTYPGIAQSLRYPEDDSWVELKLDPRAHWHDGVPITVDDVIWSFNILKKYSPYYRGYYAEVEKATKVAPDVVRFTFKNAFDRELPACMGDLVVLPKHWWLGKDKNGKQRDITKPTLEIPLGSGAYKIASFVPGKEIVWQLADNYWGKDLPVNIGRNNYGKIRYTYMRDENAQWEAFKKGGIVDYREETIMQRWMNEYNFAAAREGLVGKISYPSTNKYSPGFYFNTRREKFSDVRVRKALFLALNFDAINRSLFFNKYERVMCYYNYPVFQSPGLPTGKELEVLNKVRDLVPPEVFTKPFVGPTYKNAKEARANLEEAMDLLHQAGYVLRDGQLVDKYGKPFTIEILLSTPLNEQFTAFYAASLRKLGINVNIRNVDNAQYVNRRSSYDFDIIYEDNHQSNSPGNEQLDYFGSQLAHVHGSHNYSGVDDPAIDKLIDMLIHERDRAGVVAVAKAINRVLMWGYYRVPSWKPKTVDIAYWKKVSFPPTQPAYRGFDYLTGWINPSSDNKQKVTK